MLQGDTAWVSARIWSTVRPYGYTEFVQRSYRNCQHTQICAWGGRALRTAGEQGLGAATRSSSFQRSNASCMGSAQAVRPRDLAGFFLVLPWLQFVLSSGHLCSEGPQPPVSDPAHCEAQACSAQYFFQKLHLLLQFSELYFSI